MPLTPSHSAAALLLHRLAPRLPLAALVIGSLSPDFEYLLRLAPRGRFAHTPAGLVLFCLPVSLAVWGLYHAWMRPVVRDLMPPGLALRYAPQCHARWAAGALAALLGALSHLVWDGFTHVDGFVVTRLPPLGSVAFSAPAGLRWYTLLQHASTVLGAVAVAAYAAGRWRGLPPQARRFAPGQPRRVVAALVALFLASSSGALLNACRVADRGLAPLLGHAAVGAMVGFALGSVWVAARWHAAARARHAG